MNISVYSLELFGKKLDYRRRRRWLDIILSGQKKGEKR
jgi:hypothetical protein